MKTHVPKILQTYEIIDLMCQEVAAAFCVSMPFPLKRGLPQRTWRYAPFSVSLNRVQCDGTSRSSQTWLADTKEFAQGAHRKMARHEPCTDGDHIVGVVLHRDSMVSVHNVLRSRPQCVGHRPDTREECWERLWNKFNLQAASEVWADWEVLDKLTFLYGKHVFVADQEK